MQSFSIIVLLLFYILSWREYNQSESKVEIDIPILVRSEMLVGASEKPYNILMSKLVSLRSFMLVGTNVVNCLVKDIMGRIV